MSAPVEVALVGCGHMGAHHARVISENPRSRLVVVSDREPVRAEALAARWGARTAREIPASVDAVVIATPTTTHVRVAGESLARGQWCLVEKAVAATGDEAGGLPSDRLAVGHSERFNPAVRALGAIRPTSIEARRVSPCSDRGRDVDVLVDLMIHDLDLLGWWAAPGAALVVDEAVGARGPDGVWEWAEVRLRLGGLVASLEAGRGGAGARQMAVRSNHREIWLDLAFGRARDADGDLVHDDPRDALEAQWDAFVDAVEGRATVAVGLPDAVAALRRVEAVRAALEAT